jgi:hypothetical protein
VDQKRGKREQADALEQQAKIEAFSARYALLSVAGIRLIFQLTSFLAFHHKSELSRAENDQKKRQEERNQEEDLLRRWRETETMVAHAKNKHITFSILWPKNNKRNSQVEIQLLCDERREGGFYSLGDQQGHIS